MTDFVTLSCPSCGAKLDITPDIDRFACSHCGQEHIVKRIGGIVALSPVVEAINQVKTGVDKTAAELAIVRLQKEFEDLMAQRNQLIKANPEPAVNAFFIFSLILGIIMFLGYFLYLIMDHSSNWTLLQGGLGLSIIGIIPQALVSRNKKIWKKRMDTNLGALDEQLRIKKMELEKHHELVK